MILVLYMAVSLDGIAALDSQTGIERYGSPEDHDFFLSGSKACGAVIMGKNTSLGCKVSGVPNFVLTHDPKLLQAQDGRCSDASLQTNGRGAGFERVYLSGEPREICAELERRGIKKAALLGGPATNLRFLREGLVDEIFLTVEPVTIGRGIHFLNEPLETRWTLADTKILNERGTLVLHYVKAGVKTGGERKDGQ